MAIIRNDVIFCRSQMDLEIKDLKEWQLAMIIKNTDLEKTVARMRFDRKEVRPNSRYYNSLIPKFEQ